MSRPEIFRGFLRDAPFRPQIFLTFVFALICAAHLWNAHDCRAGDYYTDEQRQQISDTENYLRKQGLQGVSLLPGDIRSTIGWLSGGVHALPSPAALWRDDDAANEEESPALREQSSESADGVPVNLGGNLHHKGFLPTHDAMVMSMGFSRAALGDKLQFTARPFYGQNWLSTRGYWGGEMSMNIAQHADGLPWGKIAVGYVSGDESLTDSGRGLDLHGDVDLTNGLRFTSGIHQNSIDGDSNYVMLRWKLDFQ
jgi:hypothetical protein